MKKVVVRVVFLVAALSLSACSASETIHWEDNFDEAARKLERLSGKRGADIVEVDSKVHSGKPVQLLQDQVRWVDSSSGPPRTLPLNRVAQVRVSNSGALRGGLAGLATGVAAGILLPSLNDPDGQDLFFGVLLGSVAGSLLGGLWGTLTDGYLTFVRLP